MTAMLPAHAMPATGVRRPVRLRHVPGGLVHRESSNGKCERPDVALAAPRQRTLRRSGRQADPDGRPRRPTDPGDRVDLPRPRRALRPPGARGHEPAARRRAPLRGGGEHRRGRADHGRRPRRRGRRRARSRRCWNRSSRPGLPADTASSSRTPATSPPISRSPRRRAPRSTSSSPRRSSPSSRAAPCRVELLATPRSRFWRGEPRVHTFTVDVVHPGLPAQTLIGTYEQHPRLKPWVQPALIGAVGGLLLSALAWATIGRPLTQSIADDAAADALEADRVALEERIAELDAAAAEAAELPARPADRSAPGDQLQRSVNPSSSRSPSRPVGCCRSPTSCCRTRPAAVGTLALRRDGETLLESNLANFRDLDFHFVAPFRFRAGSTIELEVVCQAPGATRGWMSGERNAHRLRRRERLRTRRGRRAAVRWCRARRRGRRVGRFDHTPPASTA